MLDFATYSKNVEPHLEDCCVHYNGKKFYITKTMRPSGEYYRIDDGKGTFQLKPQKINNADCGYKAAITEVERCIKNWC